MIVTESIIGVKEIQHRREVQGWGGQGRYRGCWIQGTHQVYKISLNISNTINFSTFLE